MATRTYRYRIEPNGEQSQKMAKFFGCARKLYNLYLSWWNDEYAACKESGEKMRPIPNYSYFTKQEQYSYFSEREWDVDFSRISDNNRIAGTGEHHGLMGYERTDRNQDGAQNNRYYLPDEVVNEVANSWVGYKADGTTVTYNNEAAAEAAKYAGTILSYGRVAPKVTQYMKKSLYDLFYNDFLL